MAKMKRVINLDPRETPKFYHHRIFLEIIQNTPLRGFCSNSLLKTPLLHGGFLIKKMLGGNDINGSLMEVHHNFRNELKENFVHM